MDVDAWSAISSVASAALALAAVAIAVRTHQTEHRRSRFETARSLLQELNSGETVAVRHDMARLHYGHQHDMTPDLSDADQLRSHFASYYTMLWCFERIEAGRTSLVAGSPGRSGDPVIEYLDSRLAWHVAEFACAIPTARAQLATTAPDRTVKDRDSIKGFLRPLSALQDRGVVDEVFASGTCPGSGVCPCECHR
ncbi:hypothetical protein GCM10023335_54990 [Streptomyces siamensis]|uniref:Uncharacterized protein n=2 Tax=Streptomyces siamensis TaxID=1274986 RepID=A0ABP9J743_9ACTN